MHRRGNNLMKTWRGSNNYWLAVIVSSLILVIVVFTTILHNDAKKPDLVYKLSDQKWNMFDNLIESHPNVEFRNGTDLISQIPDFPKAVLFLAHGCSGRAVNFWDKSPYCQNCVGLPEERLIALHALTRKFAVLTISSAGICWSLGEERLIIKDIITWWVIKNKLEKLPLVALGASSGGHFVSALATNLKFNSVALMIAEGVFDQIKITKGYPPSLFVQMPKDRIRKEKIDKNIELLRNKGIDVAEIKCMEFPLYPNVLSDRIPGVDQIISVKLFELFMKNGFVDENGYMKNDGRATRWRNALRDNSIVLPDKNLVQHIQEELNLAFAYHEMTSIQSGQIFDWFESHLS